MNRGVREEPARHPRVCPVCRIAMIAERSAPELAEPDVFRRLNCGSVIVGSPESDSLSEAGQPPGAIRIHANPRALSAVDQFVTRQNIAIYERRLARETDPAQREILLCLLDGERAKQAPPNDTGRIPD